jgi:hypothetical protein
MVRCCSENTCFFEVFSATWKHGTPRIFANRKIANSRKAISLWKTRAKSTFEFHGEFVCTTTGKYLAHKAADGIGGELQLDHPLAIPCDHATAGLRHQSRLDEPSRCARVSRARTGWHGQAKSARDCATVNFGLSQRLLPTGRRCLPVARCGRSRETVPKGGNGCSILNRWNLLYHAQDQLAPSITIARAK